MSSGITSPPVSRLYVVGVWTHVLLHLQSLVLPFSSPGGRGLSLAVRCTLVTSLGVRPRLQIASGVPIRGGSPTAGLQVPLACLSGYHAVECHCSQFCGGAAVNRRGSNCRRNIDMILNKIITASAGNRTPVAQSITYSLLRVNGQELSHQQTKTEHQLEISWWLHHIILH
jgi:hypothetical protein